LPVQEKENALMKRDSYMKRVKSPSQQGYMAPTESSKAKEIEKYSPLQTTPKSPWK
jgi:hypothetical protein